MAESGLSHWAYTVTDIIRDPSVDLFVQLDSIFFWSLSTKHLDLHHHDLDDRESTDTEIRDVQAQGGGVTPSTAVNSEEEICITAHAPDVASLGGLIQSVSKMDLISALQFLKLKEISQGEILHVMHNYIDIF